MDALALLADDDEDDDDQPGEEKLEVTDSGGTGAATKLDFNCLQRAGYVSSSLAETDMYQRAGAQAPNPDVGMGAEAGSTTGADAASEMNAAERAAKLSEAAAIREALEKAAARDRKRAGVLDSESTRKKNARKMKMGQASFSLKDDRDCVNPFVDSSHDPHVRGYGGKRVDKHASAKQISNLSFTS
mmetsp:Transcript_115361/g.326009  ORF Transcript_115361/g.326009 Transcript_115361/m.326009 type:complete len:187 (+) Transcript_115361:101-661(+)